MWARVGYQIGGKFNLEDQKSKKINILLSVVVLISSVPLVYIVAPEDLERKSVYLDWKTFHEHCDSTKWHDANESLSCVYFADAKVCFFSHSFNSNKRYKLNVHFKVFFIYCLRL